MTEVGVFRARLDQSERASDELRDALDEINTLHLTIHLQITQTKRSQLVEVSSRRYNVRPDFM